ncbi:MAG: VanZ family protein [Bacilli bacterium]|nr:VanZ family protein [Bacilli bacterium]
MKNRKNVCLFGLILCMFFIFYFSHQPSIRSQSMSNEVALKILEFSSKVRKQNISEDQKENFIIKSRFLIRKLAHFFIFLVLGICMYLTLKNFKVKSIYLYSLLLCLLYASFDEFHQLFVFGRTARVLDILIDFVGAFIGILICDFAVKKHLKKKCLFK